MEQRLGNVVPLISEASYSLKNGKAFLKLRVSVVLIGCTSASYSLKNGKAFLKLRVSVVLTGCTSEFSMKSLKNMRSTFTIMVEQYLEGKSSAVMLTTSCKHSSEVIHLLVRLRRLGWKHWKCMLTLDLSGNKFVVPGIDPERSPSFLQSLVKERVQRVQRKFSFYNKRYYTAVTCHISSGYRAMTPDEVHCLKSSRLAFHVMQSSKHDTLALSTVKSDVDMCALTTELVFSLYVIQQRTVHHCTSGETEKQAHE